MRACQSCAGRPQGNYVIFGKLRILRILPTSSTSSQPPRISYWRDPKLRGRVCRVGGAEKVNEWRWSLKSWLIEHNSETPNDTLLPRWLLIVCSRLPSRLLNKFVWTCLVFRQLSEAFGSSQTQRWAQSQSPCPPTLLTSNSPHPPTILLTKRARLNSFSVSSTFQNLRILANTTAWAVTVPLSSYPSDSPFRASAHRPTH